MKPNTHDLRRNQCMLTGPFARRGYDWWWHNFTATDPATGNRRAFFIEYFLVNLARGGAEPAFGLAPDGTRGHAPSYLMVKCGAWGDGTHPGKQLHRFFGWENVAVTWGAPYAVEAADCSASDTHLTGCVAVSDADAAAHPEWMCDGGTMAWDLQVRKIHAFNVGYGAGALFRALKAFEMYWHAEGMKSAYEGWVELDGVRYRVDADTSFGYADKNWGRNFTTPWVWLSSCNLTSNLTGRRLEDSSFDIGGGKPKAFGISLPRKLLGAMVYQGRQFEFNFSKFWTGSRTRFDCRETDTQIVWHVEQSTFRGRLITDVTCQKADMLLVNYESPDGMKRFTRLWNGGNGVGRLQLFARRRGGWELVDDISAQNIGCEYGEYDPLV